MYKSKILNFIINSLIIIISLTTSIYLYNQRLQVDAVMKIFIYYLWHI